MKRLAKRHDGRLVRIRATENCLDRGMVAEGRYWHRDRERVFGFVSEDSTDGHVSVLCRDEWELLYVFDETFHLA